MNEQGNFDSAPLPVSTPWNPSDLAREAARDVRPDTQVYAEAAKNGLESFRRGAFATALGSLGMGMIEIGDAAADYTEGFTEVVNVVDQAMPYVLGAGVLLSAVGYIKGRWAVGKKMQADTSA